MADAAVGVFVKPYEEYKRRHPDQTTLPLSDSVSSKSRAASSSHDYCTDRISEESRNSSQKFDLHTSQTARRNRSNMAGAMVTASAVSLGNVFIGLSKGVLVDIPVAAADGIRAVPQLCNHQEVKDYGTVTGWKSGASVAGKTFAHGMYEGFTDIFVETYQGKKKEGR